MKLRKFYKLHIGLLIVCIFSRLWRVHYIPVIFLISAITKFHTPFVYTPSVTTEQPHIHHFQMLQHRQRSLIPSHSFLFCSRSIQIIPEFMFFQNLLRRLPVHIWLYVPYMIIRLVIFGHCIPYVLTIILHPNYLYILIFL